MNDFIHFLKIKSVYLVIILSIVLCFIYFFKKKEKLKMNAFSSFILSLLHSGIFLLSCNAMYFLEYYIGHDFLKIPKFKITTGFSFFGSTYLMPIFYIVLALIVRKKIKEVLDFGVPAILISSFCARLNCVIHGCCGGIEIGSTGFHVPTRLIELLCYVGIFLYIMYKENKGKLKPGMSLPIYYIVYGITRAIEEPLRVNYQTDTIHFGLIHSVIVLILGVILFFTFYKNNKKEIKV